MRKGPILLTCSALVVLIFPLAAQDDRPNLSGTWQFDSSKSQLRTLTGASATWVIAEDDSSIQITESEYGPIKKMELKCTTDGKECKISGAKAKASFWYNGAMLVEMESRGEHVTRYRMKLSADGKTLTVDTTSIVPQSTQDDVLVFQKQA
jgi:hypothetical protein